MIRILLFALAVPAFAQPNILLITADDLGPQVGVYGDTTVATPNIDQLAHSGAMFQTAWVTQASCSSSRASILTGLYPHQHGQLGLTSAGYALKPGITPLPNILKNHGYRTGIIGKLHISPEDRFRFDFRPKLDGRNVTEIANQATRFMSEPPPFFLMVNYSDPHLKHEGSRWYFPGVEPVNANSLPFQGVVNPERVSGYYGAIKRLDDGIGLLMPSVPDNTLIIFLGDHGPPFARAKASVYEAGLRIPFIIRWPEGEPAIRKDFVSTVDIAPTILDAAGIDIPDSLPGQPLKNHTRRSALCAQFYAHGKRLVFPRVAIRDRRYKLIYNIGEGVNTGAWIDGDNAVEIAGRKGIYETLINPPKFELYDLKSDPYEFNNIALDKPETVNRLLKQTAACWHMSA